MTLTDVVTQNREENLLIVCTMHNLLYKVNMTVLRALGAEVLRPAKQDQLAYLVQNAVSFFKFPPVSYTILIGKCCGQPEGLQQLH